LVQKTGEAATPPEKNKEVIKMRKLYQEILLLLLAVALILNSCNTTEPEAIDYHNKILFTSNRSGNNQLYMMNPNGTDIKQITSGEYWHNNGRWSPNANKIVCNTEEETTTAGSEMVVMYSDGSNRILLGWGSQMCWYPDGSKIIFSYWQGAEIGVYITTLHSIEPNGENRKMISEKYAGTFTFSPDGIKIAFSVKPDSLTRIVILNYPSFDRPTYIGPQGPYGPSWSPDGTCITFSKKEISTELNDDIYVMNSDGSNIRKITSNTSSRPYIYPRWSPDGEKIIFLAYTVDGTQKWYLYMVNKDGTDLHKVIDDDSITSCDWSK